MRDDKAAAYSADMNDELCEVAWALLEDDEQAAVAAYPAVELPTRVVRLLEPLGLAHHARGMADEYLPYLDARFVDWLHQSESDAD